MSVIQRSVQIPLFIKIERGSLLRIQDVIDEHHLQFRKPIVLSQETILARGGNDVVHALGDAAIHLVQENSIAEANTVIEEIKKKGNDVVVSVGGGRVLDMGKYIATKARINYISVPTSPSNDGLCSSVAVLKNDKRITESINVNMPVGIVVDPQIMTSAPDSVIQSGIGDVISNISAIEDWKLAYTEEGEQYDDFAASLASSAAQLIYEMCKNGPIDTNSEDFLEKLTHGLILSGIAMHIAGSSRPASGSEHEISHAIDALFPGRSTHGLQVAFATVLMTYLRNGKNIESISDLLHFFSNIGLPLRHTDIGLTDEEIIQAIVYAPKTRPDRYTILEKLELDEAGAAELLQDYLQVLEHYEA